MSYDNDIIQQIKLDGYPEFSNNNTKSISVLYNARQKYITESISVIENINFRQNPDFNIPFGDIYNENLLYGILDDENDIVLPRADAIVDVKQFFNFSNQSLLLQDFCAEAIQKMKAYYHEGSLLGKFSQESKYGNFQIIKTYSDVASEHKGMHAVFAINFKENILAQQNLNSQITDHKTFIDKYVNFLKAASRNYAITLSQAVLYSNINRFSSGIMFTIDENDAGDDTIKYEEYLFSPNFFAFAEMCKRFGFKIDKNIPWLL